MVLKFILWLATVIEDKAGAISSKRIGFFICLYMLNRAIDMPKTPEVVIYGIVILALGLAGLTVPEWFSKIKNTKTDE